MIRLFVCLLFLAGPLAAQTAVPTRTIPAHSIIGPEDITIRDVAVPGAVSDPNQIVGMETKVALYAGRPIQPGDVGFPAIIERNQLVTLVFRRSGLTITAEGRALDRAGPGDVIRVMNLSSRTTVSAMIGADGSAHVSY